jgi:hypothetical protein
MYTALVVVSLGGGGLAAWLTERQLEPWRKAEWAKDGPRGTRANKIAAACIGGAFLLGFSVTPMLFLWLG